jgi:hypothetical protein
MMGDNADSFDPGDLMFAKRVKNIRELKANKYDADGKIVELGDVIAFRGTVLDSKGEPHDNQIITHRITAIDYERNEIYTQGDNTTAADFATKNFEDVIGKCVGRWKGIGKLTLWLGGYEKVETKTGKAVNPDLQGGYGYERTGSTTTFLVIIIPLALLFVYNGFIVVKWTMDERAKKIRAAALAEAEQNTQSQEDIKRAALAEYMKANGMTEQQIEAYFAEQDAAKAAEREAEAVEQPADGAATVEQSAEQATADAQEVAGSVEQSTTDAEQGQSAQSSADNSDTQDK